MGPPRPENPRRPNPPRFKSGPGHKIHDLGTVGHWPDKTKLTRVPRRHSLPASRRQPDSDLGE